MENNEQLTAIEIIRRILYGEKALYELIVRRFNPYLYKIGRSYNFGHEDTQDLMQDTFVDAYKNLSCFEERSNFRTWIIRIMLNKCYHKKEKFSFKFELAKDNMNEIMKPMFNNTNNDVNKQIHNRELGHIIEQSLTRIPEAYRIVFSLREMNGLNVAETSEVLHISQSNVKVRLNRAKAMLRKEIELSYTATDLYEFNLIHCDVMVDRVMRELPNF